MNRVDSLLAAANRAVVVHTITFECPERRAQKLMARIAERCGGQSTTYTAAHTTQQIQGRENGSGVIWQQLRDAVVEQIDVYRKLNPAATPVSEPEPVLETTTTPENRGEAVVPDFAMPSESTALPDPQEEAAGSAMNGAATKPTPVRSTSKSVDLVARHSAALQIANTIVGPLLSSAILDCSFEEPGDDEATSDSAPPVRIESGLALDADSPPLSGLAQTAPLPKVENAVSGSAVDETISSGPSLAAAAAAPTEEAQLPEYALVWDPVSGDFYRGSVVGAKLTDARMRVLMPPSHPIHGNVIAMISPEDIIAYPLPLPRPITSSLVDFTCFYCNRSTSEQWLPGIVAAQAGSDAYVVTPANGSEAVNVSVSDIIDVKADAYDAALNKVRIFDAADRLAALVSNREDGLEVDDAELDDAREELTLLEMEHADLRVRTRESSPVPHADAGGPPVAVSLPQALPASIDRPRTARMRKPPPVHEQRTTLGRTASKAVRSRPRSAAASSTQRIERERVMQQGEPTVLKKTWDRADRLKEEREIRLLRERETARLREPEARAAAVHREEERLGRIAARERFSAAAHDRRVADHEARTRSALQQNSKIWQAEEALRERSLKQWERQEQLRKQDERDRKDKEAGKLSKSQLYARKQYEERDAKLKTSREAAAKREDALFEHRRSKHLERTRAHLANADSEHKRAAAADAGRRSMMASRIAATERQRHRDVAAEANVLQQKAKKDEQRRARDELRNTTGLHDAVKASIAKRAHDNLRAQQKGDLEAARELADARARDGRVQKEMSRRARETQTIRATFALQDERVAAQRKATYTRLAKEDERKALEEAKLEARFKAHAKTLQGIASRDAERTRQADQKLLQIEAAQAAKGRSQPFQSLAERAWNDHGQIHEERVLATRRTLKTRKEYGDILRNEAEKRQMYHETIDKAAKAEERRTLRLEAKYPA